MKKLDVNEAVAALQNDEVIAVPTDTVYGVCARMDSLEARERLSEAKNRPANKAFPIMCCDASQVYQIAKVDEQARKVIESLMPGPLTVVLEKQDGLPAWVAEGMDTVAVRIAPPGSLQEIICKLGTPVFMTSANQSGQKECASEQEIEEQCPLAYGFVEGDAPGGMASTIVDLAGGGIRILRQGPISMNTIKEKANA